MRILFFLSNADTMWRYTLPEGFIEAGHEVELTNSLDEEIIKHKILKFNPDFSISLGWGREQFIENQAMIRRCAKFSKVPHIYWSIEDPAFLFYFSLPLIQKVQPDFVFSISPSTVEFYRKMGINSAYMDFGYSQNVHKPIDHIENYASSISIVANAYPNVLKNIPNHYRHVSIETLLIPLLKNNIRVDLWGKDWDKMKAYLQVDIPNEWIHGHLTYKDANKVYCSSKIILGLQNYPNQLTQRTYEILASGGFLITCDTPAIKSIFNSGENLITSSSPENTLTHVNYYLEKSEERRKISASGKTALVGYSYKDRAEYIIKTLKCYHII